MNKEKFFLLIKPLFGKFSQSQVDGLNTFLSSWEEQEIKDIRWFAYCLATAFHETSKTMQPIKEYGGDSYFFKMYDVNSPLPNRAKLAKENGQLPGDGIKFPGRGFVQLTWRPNYAKASQLVGVDLVNFPDKAMDPKIAFKVMFEGMRIGMFTGKKLGDYFNGRLEDWVGARKIINGTDKDTVIAEYAKQFYTALKGSIE